MTTLRFLNISLKVSIIALVLLAIDVRAQQTTEKATGSVASFVRDLDAEAGLVRSRVAPTEAKKTGAKSSTADLFEQEKQAFDLINAKRAEMGIGPIRWNDDVARIARIHSENMANFGFFSHRGRDGKMVDDRADDLGFSKWTALGENIAYNRGFKDPIAIAVEKWLESPSHRQNLLNGRWKESGIGIAVAPDGTYYLTQVFMVRK